MSHHIFDHGALASDVDRLRALAALTALAKEVEQLQRDVSTLSWNLSREAKKLMAAVSLTENDGKASVPVVVDGTLIHVHASGDNGERRFGAMPVTVTASLPLPGEAAEGLADLSARLRAINVRGGLS